jgi:hypothetical protein
VIVGDLDNDGRVDLVLDTRSGPQLWLADEGGRWSWRPRRLPADLPALAAEAAPRLADWDDDGDLDLLASTADGPQLLRNDVGDFVPAPVPALGAGRHLAVDADRDGRLDLLWLAADGPARLARGAGNLTFDEALPLPAPPGVAAAAAGDLDDDGRIDLALAGPEDLGVWRGVAATFEAGARVAATGAELLIDELTGDGRLDLVLADAGRTWLLQGDGAGGLTPTGESLPGSSSARRLDLDSDGDIDLLLLGPTQLLTNDGAGSFSADPSDLPPARAAAIADVDADGDEDLLLATADGTLWLRNDAATRGRWLDVLPVGEFSARSGPGPRLRLHTGAGTVHRQVTASTAERGDRGVRIAVPADVDVERLEVTWPAGGTDGLVDPPMDERIYLYEGRTIYSYFPAGRTAWTAAPPETLRAGEPTHIELAVRPALEEPKAGIDAVTADLTELGGPFELPLPSLGGGDFGATVLVTPDAVGWREVRVVARQSTLVGHPWMELSRLVYVAATTAVTDGAAATRSAVWLERPFPNPANASVTISFSATEATNLHLQVVNLAGQPIRLLRSGAIAAGDHRVGWEGRVDAGRPAASGVYLLHLRTGDTAQTRRLALIR